MGLELDYIGGLAPLDDDEKDGLLIPTIGTQTELDEFEHHNIETAIQWTLSRSFSLEEVLSETFVRRLHKRMFGSLWKWAGEFRKTNKNIGVDKRQIGIELHKLIDDCRYWIANRTYSEDEIAMRFKHRLVSIHCFQNGNGRHARLMADILIGKILKRPVFTWGSISIFQQGEARTAYISALRSADEGKMEPLITFARS